MTKSGSRTSTRGYERRWRRSGMQPRWTCGMPATPTRTAKAGRAKTWLGTCLPACISAVARHWSGPQVGRSKVWAWGPGPVTGMVGPALGGRAADKMQARMASPRQLGEAEACALGHRREGRGEDSAQDRKRGNWVRPKLVCVGIAEKDVVRESKTNTKTKNAKKKTCPLYTSYAADELTRLTMRGCHTDNNKKNKTNHK